METYKVVIKNGWEYWYNEAGEFHRNGGPAASRPLTGFNAYYQDGKLHREDGPAITYSDGRGYYYLRGKEYTKEDWEKATSSIQSCNGKIVEIDGKQYRLEEI